ncbi:universal stress protein [Flavobacterium granuli]|uniref:Nucleotide-binding universal stress UspA family protein n=1 Tax=Flavobacterium granuli TaxID=280093 RepID=A0ABU1S3F6_9FLAO|nr:universal stress protein [Flavobacterium granuli]MDR6845558.1 nucleotide-binding universal stress UspA family protein [Flavobacterium granuli]
MKKILFPTDFSEVSKNAFIYALKLADAINAEIITLHVYELDSPAFLDVSIYLQDIYEYEELNDFENYKDEVPLLRNIAEENNLGHIKMRNVLIQGYLVKEVVKLSEKENIDFIVMGTKGITHLREVFLGTIATKIMNECNTTVLAIPEKCIYSPIEKILFNTRFHMDDIEPLKKVVALANVFHSHVDCLNVKPLHTVYTDDFVVDFKNVFKEHNVAFHSVLGNDIEGAILNFIDQNKIDMIAIHERHRGFFDKLFQISLSKKLTFNISIPILSVH